MKHSIVNLFILVLFVMSFASCSMEKRRYMDGYHVEWMHRHKETLPIAEKSDSVSSVQPMEFKQTDALLAIHLVSDSADVATDQNEIEFQKPERKRSLFHSGKEKTKREQKSFYPVLGFQGLNQTSQKIDIDTSGKNITAVIGFVFALLAIACLIIAFVASEGWSALGYLALAFLFTLGASLFSFIAFILFKRAHERLPWYEWIGLLVGLLGLYMALRIWVFKG